MEGAEMHVLTATCPPGLTSLVLHADLAPASHVCGAERRRIRREVRKAPSLWWLWACASDGEGLSLSPRPMQQEFS